MKRKMFENSVSMEIWKLLSCIAPCTAVPYAVGNRKVLHCTVICLIVDAGPKNKNNNSFHWILVDTSMS
jgi:hypothetical protein